MTPTLIADTEVIAEIRELITATKAALNDSLNREKQIAAEADRNRLFTTKEACEYLRRDKDSLLNYRRIGLIPYKKGANVWYRKGDIDDWLESGRANRHKR